MKEYSVNLIKCGQNVFHIVVCKSRKRAAELLNTQVSYINKYGYTSTLRTQQAIDNPEKVYGYSDSGLIFQHRPDLLNVVLPIEDLINIIKSLK